MTIQYEQIDEITSDDLRPDMYYQIGSHVDSRHRLPTVIGVVQIICGFITTFLGILEVLLVPMMENNENFHILFTRTNCYGAGILAGIFMVITGSAAARASISRRKTSVIKFYNLTLFTFIIYVALMIFLIVAYSLGWTTHNAYPEGSRLHSVHMFVVIFTVLGMMFTLTSLVKYFNVVFGGDIQLFQQWLECCPCTREQIQMMPVNDW
ncbi:uncharacterized protein LOC121377796 isoform X2 [Gigantopelta aegis]|uniref:uncharacterized protein LOC121377796 isoform X2 n=1 Tax=Gigantopelta aegis TaxID=1735272 RepID=UPI001B888BFD|nr:uncharacterized protein LOC121377796 isoform X2 [Gigantopelta aegis]XP_041361828.1 uncharacterized protein LOC121377796 isoform X2 [Gigantopelta aegis]